MEAIISQKDLFRLSALLYSETSQVDHTSVLSNLIQSIFVQNDNIEMYIDDIAAKTIEISHIVITQNEIREIVNSNRRIYVRISSGDYNTYKLTEEAYKTLSQRISNGIDKYVQMFISQLEQPSKELACEAIYKYLYELSTTNINSYKVLIQPSSQHFSEKELSVDLNLFSDIEQQFISQFMNWENSDKDEAIASIIVTCLEYCLLVSGDSVNTLTEKFIKSRYLYLDTNIIFRFMGINGQKRQGVLIAFLDKCLQAHVTLRISTFTHKEFWDTIQFYLDSIKNYPRGRIFSEAYALVSDFNIYSFYDEWLQNHEGVSMVYFIGYLQSIFDSFVEKYKIEVSIDKDINIFHPSATTAITTYDNQIKKFKRDIKENEDEKFYDEYYVKVNQQSNRHDAILIYTVETKRRISKDNGLEDYFVISSDKALRYWDMAVKSQGNPIVLYPSQFFVMLIKICGRSTNDFKSFVNFIKVSPSSQKLGPEQANIILSAISSITEDIVKQKELVSSIFTELQNIIPTTSKEELYEATRLYSQHYLEGEMAELHVKLVQMETVFTEQTEKIIKLQGVIEETVSKGQITAELLDDKDEKIKKNNETIRIYAMKKIKVNHALKWYIAPLCLLLLSIAYILFVGFQILFCNQSWNFATQVFNYLGTTTFGKNADYLYLIDAALFGGIFWLFKKFWRNPYYNKKEKEIDKQNMAQKYIEDNKLIS